MSTADTVPFAKQDLGGGWDGIILPGIILEIVFLAEVQPMCLMVNQQQDQLSCCLSVLLIQE